MEPTRFVGSALLSHAGSLREEGILVSGMKTATVQIELPSDVSEQEARLLLLIQLYELGRLSIGQAARLAGFSKRAFLEVLAQYGTPVVNYAPEELHEELEP